jgi:hypothetical protein
MIQRAKPNITELIAARKPIDEALTRGIRQAMLRHKRLGESVVGWKNGRPILIPPEEIPDNEPASEKKPN